MIIRIMTMRIIIMDLRRITNIIIIIRIIIHNAPTVEQAAAAVAVKIAARTTIAIRASEPRSTTNQVHTRRIM
jgi:hypothetical protein